LYQTYGSDGYYWIIAWEDTLDYMTDYFNTNGWSATNCYEDPSLDSLGPWSAAYGGGSGGIPQNALLDRDGNVRLYAVVAIDGEPRATQWTNAVKELVGVS